MQVPLSQCDEESVGKFQRCPAHPTAIRAKFGWPGGQFRRWPGGLAGKLPCCPGQTDLGLALTAPETATMSRPLERSLFERLTSRRPRPARAQEPADMGTAFGMEAWLATPGSELATPSATPAPPPRRRSRWLPGSGK